jgi:hypothetical protein
MKSFIKIFFILLLFEIILGILNLYFNNQNNFISIKWFFAFFNNIVAMPLSLIDRTYPFYAEGFIYQGVTLSFVNLLLQTTFVFFMQKLARHLT